MPTTLDAPVIDATFECLGLRWPILADDPVRPVARAEHVYQRVAPTLGPWSDPVPAPVVDRSARGFGKAIVGSCLDLDAGATYRVRLHAYDAAGARLLEREATAATRPDAIPAPGCLVPTHHVRAEGSDAGDGSWAAPWRTLQKAITTAPGGAVVQVGPGYFQRPTSTRAAPIALVAEHPAVASFDAARLLPLLAPRAERTTVYAHMVAPAASTLPDDQAVRGGWTSVAIDGRQLWTRDLGVQDVQTIAWRRLDGGDHASEKAGPKRRLACWQTYPSGPSATRLIDTVEMFAAILRDNLSYGYGFYSPPGSTVVYLRLPGDVDPNACWLFYAAATSTSPLAEVGFNMAAPDCRVSGFAYVGLANDVRLSTNADRAVLDSWFSDCSRQPVVLNGSDTDDLTVDDVTIQDYYDRSTDVTNDGSQPDPCVPWATVKVGPIDPATDTYWRMANGATGQKPLGNLENCTVMLRYCGRRTVIRRGRTEGRFNAIGGAPAARPTDICNVDLLDLYAERLADNAWELEGEVENARIVRCRADRVNSPLASSLAGGPIYTLDGVTWRGNHRLLGPTRRDVPTDVYTAGCAAWKYGNSAEGHIIEARCTYWNDQLQLDGGGTDGYASASGSSLGTRWTLRGTVCRTTGLVAKSTSPRTLLDCVEAGASSPTLAGQIDAALADPTHGDLTPVPGGMCDGRGARCHTAPVPAVAT